MNRYPWRCLLVALALAAWSRAAAALTGDADCNGVLDARDVDAVVVAMYSGTLCRQADVNGDATVSAADLAGVTAELMRPLPTPTATATSSATASASPTATATPTSSPSPTSTPTSLACPSGAVVRINVDNLTGTSPIAFTVSGRLTEPSCRNLSGLSEFYTLSASSSDPAPLPSELAPGKWVHSISVDAPATGQLQYQPGLVLANSGANIVHFTAFASVGKVLNPIDGAGSGTLRDALVAASAAAKPHLIQFDEVLFPSGMPTTVILRSALPVLSSSNITIDGTDAEGSNGNRILDADGRPNSVLVITGAANSIIGLRLRNTGANNRDVISITGSAAYSNLIERCRVELSATGDGIGIDAGAGDDLLSTANIVRATEISHASDKGIKVTTNAYARVERSWIHDNANGGVQSTLSGHVLTRDNLIEHNAGNAQARNGLSVNGAAPDTPLAASELAADGDIARFNGGNGISLRGLSLATVSNAYLVANQQDGMRVSTEGSPATAVVQGTAFACNSFNGGVVDADSQADLGGGALGSPGNNAFTQNNLPGGFENLLNQSGATLFAINNQWEHCGRELTCDDAAIAAYDVSDHGRMTLFTPAQAHRSHRAPAVTAVRPSQGVAGDLVRIFGNGFNVIDGHAADATCADVGSRNRCLPLRGNCVRIGDISAPIEAVTPTMIAVRLPVSCIEPVNLTVTTQEGGISAPVLFCTNAAP